MIKEYYASLTGIRAVAAFMVVIHHLLKFNTQSGYVESVIRELNVGVNIFFVLSGFLIYHRYARNVVLNKKWFKSYLINRIARIYPLFFFLTTVFMVLGFLAKNGSIKDILLEYFLNVSLLKGFSSEYVYSGISQAWTLSVEELFYLSAPFIFVINIRNKIPLALIGLGIMSVGFFLYYFFKDINFLGFFNDLNFMKITTFFGRFTEFFIGIALAKYLTLNSKSKERSTYTILGFIAITVSILVFLPFLQGASKYSIQSNLGYLFNVLILPFFIAVFFYGLIIENTYLKKLLSSKFLILLGKSSYALYLVHWGMLSYLINRFIGNNIIVEIIITYVISILLWRYIEEPANKYIRKTYNQRLLND